MVPTVPKITNEIKKQLVETELGNEKADLVIRNGKLINVYTKEIINNIGICIKGEWIAYVGPNPTPSIGPETTVLDVEGQTMIPGLIDGHTHLAYLVDVSELIPYAILGGTTTIITEILEPFLISGIEGVEEFLCVFDNQPIKIYGTAPSAISITDDPSMISNKDLNKLLSRPDILGLGESYWQAVLQEKEKFIPIFERVLATGKTVEGHSAGATDKKLAAYIACGVSSCHESINSRDALERLRMGLYVMIREGSIRRDLASIASIVNKNINHRRLILVSDTLFPDDLINKGYMEYIVQKAIDYDFPPITAIQMATLNVAQHFGIDSYVGGIAPGRQADIVIIPDVQTIKPNIVISRGKVVSKSGKVIVDSRKHNYSKKLLNTVNLSQPLSSDDFTISSSLKKGSAKVRVIDVIDQLVTQEKHLDLPVINGKITSNPKNGLLKVAAVDRNKHTGKCFTGLIQGFGMRTGAISSSAAGDSSAIIVVGANDLDMAFAANRVAEMNGGLSLVVDGTVQEEIALPIFGLISQEPIIKVLDSLRSMKSVVQKLGFPYDDPFLTLNFLTSPACPFFRICAEGLVNLKDGKIVGLFV